MMPASTPGAMSPVPVITKVPPIWLALPEPSVG